MSLVKNEKIKEKPINNLEKSHTLSFCRRKVEIFMKMITDTILAVQKYKSMDIITASDMNICIQNLEMLLQKVQNSTKGSTPWRNNLLVKQFAKGLFNLV